MTHLTGRQTRQRAPRGWLAAGDHGRDYEPLPPEPATLVSEGRVSEAVKILRQSHGLETRRARAWIDTHIADDPMLGVQLEVQRRARIRRVFCWLATIVILIAAGVVYYPFHLPR